MRRVCFICTEYIEECSCKTGGDVVNPHKQCIDKLQELVGCACIGDCLTEVRGTLLSKPNLENKEVTIDELDNFLDNFEVIANKDLLIRRDIAKYLVIKFNITKR